MLEQLLPQSIYNCLLANAPLDLISEIRLRIGRPVCYALNGVYRFVDERECHAVTTQELDHVVAMATRNSLYACNDWLVEGYLPYEGGIRVGIAGQGVVKNGALTTVKSIAYICIRIPRAATYRNGALDRLIEHFDNTVIVSRPGLGKTTLLRDCIRRISDDGYQTLVLDERGELSGSVDGACAFDLGKCSDVCVGVPKLIAYRTLIRTMRPDVVATDEVFGGAEVDALADCVRCGVKLIATVHANDLQALACDPVYRRMTEFMRYAIVLKGVGYIAAVTELHACGR